jgi:LmbE family N-acetylglucosaminyl deacetylase
VHLTDLLAGPRTMLVAAHPDDETVGASTLLRRLVQARFVYVTDGAPRDGRDAARHGWSVAEYREARRRERAEVFALCGLDPSRIIELDCPDQQAALRFAPLACELAACLDEYGIDTVLTHPYEGGHPDHDAAAFIVHAAAHLARRTPVIVEMSSYHNGPNGLVGCEFLPDAAVDSQTTTTWMSPQQRTFKQSLVDRYVSQRDTLRWLPFGVERFRPAPRYDFRVAPHAGRLWFEMRDWGIDGPRFRELAADAMRGLGIAS